MNENPVPAIPLNTVSTSYDYNVQIYCCPVNHAVLLLVNGCNRHHITAEVTSIALCIHWLFLPVSNEPATGPAN